MEQRYYLPVLVEHMATVKRATHTTDHRRVCDGRDGASGVRLVLTRLLLIRRIK